MNRFSRLGRGGLVTDVVLIAILLILAIIFIHKKSAVSNSVAKQQVVLADQPTDGAQYIIDKRIKAMPDLRSTDCKNNNYQINEKVTIILHFFDYDFYDLKVTVSALLKNTEEDLIQEVIVVDDGSTLAHIKDESRAFIRTVPKSRLIVLPDKIGPAKARMVGFGEVTTDIVVFIDKSALVGNGWLEPLIQTLKEHPDSIVTPHFDQVTEPVSYDLRATSENLITTFSWMLKMRATESKNDKKSGDLYETPVFRGNVFAVTKTYFSNIGGYDPGFQDAGGENLELSIRSWLCGGPVYVQTCSHVGLLNIFDPVLISSAQNIRRIAELWFQERKSNIYRSTMIDSQLSSEEQKSIQAASDSHKSCKDMSWYLTNVLHEEIATPSSNAKLFGLLRCKTMVCARLGPDNRIDLVNCKPDKYGVYSSDTIFEYNAEGYIKVNGKCVTTKESAYVMGEECKQKDSHQAYTITDTHTIKNTWSNFCLMHVTDPDEKFEGKRQIVMAQDCGSDSSGGKFVTWDFVPL